MRYTSLAFLSGSIGLEKLKSKRIDYKGNFDLLQNLPCFGEFILLFHLDALEDLLPKQLPAGLATTPKVAFSNALIFGSMTETTKEENKA